MIRMCKDCHTAGHIYCKYTPLCDHMIPFRLLATWVVPHGITAQGHDGMSSTLRFFSYCTVVNHRYCQLYRSLVMVNRHIAPLFSIHIDRYSVFLLHVHVIWQLGYRIRSNYSATLI